MKIFLRNVVKQNVRTDPACPPSARSERFALLDDLTNKEMLWDYKKIGNAK